MVSTSYFFSDNNAIKFHHSGFVMPSLWVRYASAPNLPQTYPQNECSTDSGSGYGSLTLSFATEHTR